ncbi:MAG TPA: hypothetical protein VHV10_19910 [Ktedonobacteraceae bacterium]|nr:hypothetical protein [Ktedonobacteraceae bacterium]
MKSLHERLDDRLDGDSDADPDVDELVILARHMQATSQPDPIFAQRLEQKVRMHALQQQVKQRSWWSMPPLWMRFVLATLLCLFLMTSTILAVASLKPNGPVKIWEQHSPNVLPTPHLETAPPTPYLQRTVPSEKSSDGKRSSGGQSSGTSTPEPAGKNDSLGKSTSSSNTPSPPVVPASTPTPTPTPAPILCLIKICL